MTNIGFSLFPQTDQQTAAWFSWENQPVAVELAQGTTKPTRLGEPLNVLCLLLEPLNSLFASSLSLLCSWKTLGISSKPSWPMAWSRATSSRPMTCLKTETWPKSRPRCSRWLAWWANTKKLKVDWGGNKSMPAVPACELFFSPFIGKDQRYGHKNRYRGEICRQTSAAFRHREDQGWSVCHWTAGNLNYRPWKATVSGGRGCGRKDNVEDWLIDLF